MRKTLLLLLTPVLAFALYMVVLPDTPLACGNCSCKCRAQDGDTDGKIKSDTDASRIEKIEKTLDILTKLEVELELEKAGQNDDGEEVAALCKKIEKVAKKYLAKKGWEFEEEDADEEKAENEGQKPVAEGSKDGCDGNCGCGCNGKCDGNCGDGYKCKDGCDGNCGCGCNGKCDGNCGDGCKCKDGCDGNCGCGCKKKTDK